MRRPAALGQKGGQAMVEFALVGPIFLLLLFGIAEGALFVNAVASLDNAVREGARAAAICGATNAPVTTNGQAYGDCDSAIRGAITDRLGILPVNGPGPTTSLCTSSTNPCITANNPQPPGNTVTVTVVYHYGYYVNALLAFGPTTDIISNATVVSQR